MTQNLSHIIGSVNQLTDGRSFVVWDAVKGVIIAIGLINLKDDTGSEIHFLVNEGDGAMHKVMKLGDFEDEYLTPMHLMIVDGRYAEEVGTDSLPCMPKVEIG